MIVPWRLAELAGTRAAQVLLPLLLLSGQAGHRAGRLARSLRGLCPAGVRGAPIGARKCQTPRRLEQTWNGRSRWRPGQPESSGLPQFEGL